MEEKKSNKGWADGLRSEVLEKYLIPFKAAWFGSSREAEVNEVSPSSNATYVKTHHIRKHP